MQWHVRLDTLCRHDSLQQSLLQRVESPKGRSSKRPIQRRVARRHLILADRKKLYDILILMMLGERGAKGQGQGIDIIDETETMTTSDVETENDVGTIGLGRVQSPGRGQGRGHLEDITIAGALTVEKEGTIPEDRRDTKGLSKLSMTTSCSDAVGHRVDREKRFGQIFGDDLGRRKTCLVCTV